MTIYHGCRLASCSRSFSVPVCLRDRFSGLVISSHPLCDRRHSAPAYHPARLASWRPLYEQRSGTKYCGRTAQTRSDFTPTRAPGSRGNRTMGPTSACSCSCRWSNFSHRLCCVHRIDSGLAGTAPLRSHGPLKGTCFNYRFGAPSAHVSSCPIWRISWICARSSSKLEFRYAV